MIEQTFQEMFKNKWDKNLEEEKIPRKLATKYPTQSVSDICPDKVMLMYIKAHEESEKCKTYLEMWTMALEETTGTQEQLHLLMDKLDSANSEKEVEVVNAEMEEEKDALRCLETARQLIKAKMEEQFQNAKEWELMLETHKK